MSRIALIRHGQTAWSASGKHTGTTDIDLTDEGVAQARIVPELLTGLGLAPATVYVSPRLRARRTAELAGLGSGLVLDDLAEWNYGDYEGRTSVEIHQERPGWLIFADGAPGGESPQQVSDRADRVLAVAREALEHGDVALVCHGHFSRALAVRWVDLPVEKGYVVAMAPAAVTVLGFYHGGPIIDHANVTPFLPGGPR